MVGPGVKVLPPLQRIGGTFVATGMCLTCRQCTLRAPCKGTGLLQLKEANLQQPKVLALPAQQLPVVLPGCQRLSAAQYVETDMQQLQLRQRHDPRQAQEAIEAQVIPSSASEQADYRPGRTSGHVRHSISSGCIP